MPKMVILRGLPASGKSTWAKAYVKEHSDYVRVNKDDLRAMLLAGKWNKDLEKRIVDAEEMLISQSICSGCNVIVDNTHGWKKHIDRLVKLADSLSTDISQVEVEVMNFFTPLEVCIERDAGRPSKVGEDVIRGMYTKYFREDYPQNLFFNDPKKPGCIVADLDGTMALLEGRSPYDASTCEKDRPNWPVIQAVIAYAKHYKLALILVSGREDKYKRQTESWLANTASVPYQHMYMRATGDNRKDSIIKEEIYRDFILPHYHVHAVFDDRNQVVDHLRSLGLTVFQVAPGNF